MLNKNYFYLLTNPVSWKNGVNKIIHDIDDRLKKLESNQSSETTEHEHENYLTYEDTISNAEKLNGKQDTEFALKEHIHQGVCYIYPFNCVDEATLTIPNPVDNEQMFILNNPSNLDILNTELSEDGTTTTISVVNQNINDNNTYYLLYWHIN